MRMVKSTMKKLLGLILVLALCCAPALAEVGLTDFSTVDMNGKPVTEAVFADYDLTVVRIWGTWCGYCVYDMPELIQLKTMLPENVNLITICDDAADEPELAAAILNTVGATFQTLVPSPEIYDQLLNSVYIFPTTYFLDSNGVSVGEPINGVISMEGDGAELYAGVVQEVLNMLEE